MVVTLEGEKAWQTILRRLKSMREINRCTKPEHLPEWLTPEEFRAYMDFGRTKVYEMIRTEEIPHKRFGRLIRIPKGAALN